MLRLLSLLLFASPLLAADKPEVPPKEAFNVDGHPAFVILPKGTDGKARVPWVWYAPTFPNLPEAREHWMFQKFLAAGIAIAGVDVGESYGSPKGRAAYTALHKELVGQRNFAPKAVLLARSRGGLMLYNWAVENPESVAGIAGIYPVCDLRSYPGLDKACGAYGLTRDELEKRLDQHNPVARLAPLAKAGVPIFHIHGDVDKLVPLEANSGEVAKRYAKLGGKMELVVPKGQGHNLWDGFFQCQDLVDFVLARSEPSKEPKGTGAKPVKVFVLAGQSNMEGKAPDKLFDFQATDDKTKGEFAHLRKDGKWVVRDDVFIKFLDRKGPLTLGFGSPGRTGMEYEFGTMMGNHFDEPVVLVKAAWGGHSLAKNFRPPSAKLPPTEELEKELKQAQDRVKMNNEKNKKDAPLPTLDDIKKPYGLSYRNMLAEVAGVMKDAGTLFPALKGKELQLAGFVWFQGWNDQYNGYEKEYEANMAHFIRDVRKDLNAPKLPVVIAVMGQNMSKPATGPMAVIQKAQLAMADVSEFKGTVKAVRTDVLVDKAAEELFPTWNKTPETKAQWDKTGGDFPYHYLGSALWFTRIGHACGDAMLELLKAGK